MTSIELISKSLQTIKEMLIDRGINIENIENININEIQELVLLPIFTLDVNDNFRIIYNLSKFNYSNFQKKIGNKKHILLVIKEKLTSFSNVQKNIDKEDKNLELEIFLIKELKINISKHFLVPKHEIIMDQEEVKDIIKEFKVKNKTQFPIITKEDPMSKYLYAKSGDLLRITRNSPSSGTSIIYRYCI
jgi:DNA-directed RNA polymerase I, II, and III subunit RPABC1